MLIRQLLRRWGLVVRGTDPGMKGLELLAPFLNFRKKDGLEIGLLTNDHMEMVGGGCTQRERGSSGAPPHIFVLTCVFLGC
jgi:hypothetical protein